VHRVLFNGVQEALAGAVRQAAVIWTSPEEFASLLALADPDGIVYQHMGREATAKGYGIMALYLVR
jgi:hypothetical protein